MNKKDVKNGIKNIQLVVKDFNENYEEQLKPLEVIKEHIDKLKDIEENNGIDLEIDWEEIEGKAIRSLLVENEYISNIEETIDQLECDLEDWSGEASENKAEQIQEIYIEPLQAIKELLSIDSVQCIEDIDNMVGDIREGLNEYFNN